MENIRLVFDSIVIKEDEGGGYSSLCLDLDVASQGDTMEEAKNMLIEAVEGYIEVSIENNLPIYRPVPKEENPVFTNPESVVERFKIMSDLKINTYV